MDEVKKTLTLVLKGQESLRRELLGRVDKTEKMLRAVINGQSAHKQELLKEIRKNRGKIDNNKQEIKRVEKVLSKRIDKIGKSVAFLEDDTPTREEFGKLEETVEKVATKTSLL